MLTEHIIDFELRGPGPPGCACTSITGYFYDKTKPLRKIFEWVMIYCWNIARGNVPYFPYQGQITYEVWPQNARF